MIFKCCQTKHPFRFLLLSVLLLSTLVSAGSDEDIDDLDEDDDDDEKEKEPIAKRQFTAMRDTIKSVVGNSVKLLTNARVVKGVSNFVQKAPAATGSAAVNLYQALRSHWLKQTSTAQKNLIKQLQGLTKRLSNSRLLLGNIGAKLSNREESATKNTKAEDVVPTSLPKEESESRKETGKTKSQRQSLPPHMRHPYPFHQPMPHMPHPLQAIPSAHVYAHPDSQYFAPPPVQPVDPMIMDPLYGGW